MIMNIRLAALFLLCLLLPQMAIAEESGTINGTTLELTVDAQSRVAPDEALIDAGVVTSGTTPSQAMEANAQKMGAVIKAVKAAGIADKDIQTSYVSLNPQYNYGKLNSGNDGAPKIVSYQASNTINIIVRNLQNVGPILDAVVGSGANQISGPNFSVENMQAAYDGLRKEAVDKAQKRAALYAAASGLKVKRIISISESNNAFRPAPVMMRAMAAAAPAATPVAPGELTIEATLDVKYELTAQ